ncbi:hypothetical protein ACIGNX_30960 [Actinosynnema sp. NPDC053489]|uniref:hypothetical protein n=1 Tax=Actinosynnema sp. NPDC053489 TaxID=3363916 RepID=UPI0037CB5068
MRHIPEELLTRATQAVDNARRHLTGGVIAGDVSDSSAGDDVAHATADMLIAVARALDDSEPGALAEVVGVYERAATAPRRGQPF